MSESRVTKLLSEWSDDGASRGTAYMLLRDLAYELESQLASVSALAVERDGKIQELAMAAAGLDMKLASEKSASRTQRDYIDGLESQLASEKAAREKYETLHEKATAWAMSEKQRAEAAEQRIKESQEQEPEYQYWIDSDHGGWIGCTKEHYDSVRECDRQIVYKQPIIPHTVEELIDEIRQMRKGLINARTHIWSGDQQSIIDRDYPKIAALAQPKDQTK